MPKATTAVKAGAVTKRPYRSLQCRRRGESPGSSWARAKPARQRKHSPASAESTMAAIVGFCWRNLASMRLTMIIRRGVRILHHQRPAPKPFHTIWLRLSSPLGQPARNGPLTGWASRGSRAPWWAAQPETRRCPQWPWFKNAARCAFEGCLPWLRHFNPGHNRYNLIHARSPGGRRHGLAFGNSNSNLSRPKDSAARLTRTVTVSGLA